MCWILERDGSAALGSQALRASLDGKVTIERPELPAFRGALTIAELVGMNTPGAYAEAVTRWARSTWDAYAPLHALARGWVEAVAGR